MKNRTVLFDVDGVLAYTTNSADALLAKLGMAEEEFFLDWSISDCVTCFEAGCISPEEFAIKRARELNYSIDPEDILRVLRERKSLLYPGTEEILRRLAKRQMRMACISNTNVLHWNGIESRGVFDRYFHRQYLSFRLGMTKPDKRIFSYAAEDLHCTYDELLYFDDSERNICAARALGIKAVQVRGIKELTDELSSIFAGEY